MMYQMNSFPANKPLTCDFVLIVGADISPVKVEVDEISKSLPDYILPTIISLPAVVKLFAPIF